MARSLWGDNKYFFSPLLGCLVASQQHAVHAPSEAMHSKGWWGPGLVRRSLWNQIYIGLSIPSTPKTLVL